jgi:predicted transcriptional regulator
MQLKGMPMKTATFPSLRVTPELRQAAEQILEDGETLSGFVEQSIREGIERRQIRQEFIARGLRSRDDARQTGQYASAESVVSRLEQMLAAAKGSQ